MREHRIGEGAHRQEAGAPASAIMARLWAAHADADCGRAIRRSLRAAGRVDEPFPHWLLTRTLPANVLAALAGLPLEAPTPGRAAGTREAQNDMRRYFDTAAIGRFQPCRAVALAFQSTRTVRTLEQVTGARLDGASLRIEYAQDLDGFWLAPHTDLGVKRLTLLCYLGAEDQDDLGTDLYRAPGDRAGRAPFAPGAGLAFVPSDSTWHGFEPRPIRGVRKSLIVNFVSDEWRAREQLAFPEKPVGGRRWRRRSVGGPSGAQRLRRLGRVSRASSAFLP